MARARETQLVARGHAGPSPLERVLAAADVVRDQAVIARAGAVYARGIYAPNIKEPFYISNRRDDLVALVRAFDRKQHQAEFGRKSRRAA